MKRLLFTCCILLVHAAITVAQVTETAFARIVYAFTHIDDTTQRHNPYEEDLVLLMGKNNSLYKSFTAIQEQAEMQRQIKEAKERGGAINIDLSNSGFKSSSTAQYILFHASKRLIKLETLFRTKYVIEESYPEPDWKIVDEEKQIGGYLAQKATTHFGGRDYTVWFTPEIPLPFGPWKLHGLPGLILEARDSKNEVGFAYGGFETLENNEGKIEIPNGTVAVTQSDYDKAAEAFEENPQVVLNNALAASESKARITSLQKNTSSITHKGKTKNNPVELDN